MFSKNEPQPTKELYAATRAWNLEDVKSILEQYKEQGLKPDRGTLAAAINAGSIPLVEYFKSEHNLIPKSGVMDAVEEAKSFEMAQYLMNTYPTLRMTIDYHITWVAARTGNLDMLKFFLQRKFFLKADEGTLYDAVNGGNLDMVKYLVDDYGLTDITEAHEFADTSGKKEIASYFQEKINSQQMFQP